MALRPVLTALLPFSMALERVLQVLQSALRPVDPLPGVPGCGLVVVFSLSAGGVRETGRRFVMTLVPSP